MRLFGENRVQEAAEKAEHFADRTDLGWAMIGHLQTNKARQAARFATEFHALDSLKVAEALQARGFVVSEAQFNQMFPSRNGFYSYSGLTTAMGAYSQFATTGSDTVRKQEAAAFLAERGIDAAPAGGSAWRPRSKARMRRSRRA